LAMMFKL